MAPAVSSPHTVVRVPRAALVAYGSGKAKSPASSSALPHAIKIHDKDTRTPLTCHSDLWFEDGSVVCRAENTLFRVHMSQLARQSECFRDMFALASANVSSSASIRSFARELEEDEQYAPEEEDVQIDVLENCPIIFLHDRARDVASFFAALYDGPTFDNNSRTDFETVSGVLRLSTKYIIDPLREKALAHLQVAWPSTLRGWDLREDLARTYEIDTLGGRLYPNPIEVINLAREVNAPCLLPSAFYDLCRYSYAQIFEPTEDDPFFPSSSSTPFPFSLPTLAQLCLPDTQRFCMGKEAAHCAITSMIQAMGTSQHIIRNGNVQVQVPTPALTTNRHNRRKSTNVTTAALSALGTTSSSAVTGGVRPGICVSAAACRKDFTELVDLATQHYLFDRERGFCDPLYVAEELGQLKSAEFSECKGCARSLEFWASRERERMWRMIPVWFRLDGWGGASPVANDY